jgi:oxygen-independent coproporphyrinogen-3 oxidase
VIRHLYLHVPFCRRRCSYCDFDIAVRRSVPAADFVAAVRAELDWRRADGLDVSRPLETVYFGGGTPSLLPPEALAELFEIVCSRWALAPGAEVTLEANPEDVDREAARVWRAAGVNRVSLGVQSFDDEVLAWMRRPHRSDAPARAVAHLREAGIENVSLDLIFALPPHLTRNWSRDLDHAIGLGPDHLSLYGLSIEPGTPLARWIARGEVARAGEERYAADYLAAHEALAAAGFEFYELSNAARAARFSRHNAAYWLGEAYLGLGPAAHAFVAGERSWNVPAWEAYRRAVHAGHTPVADRERLDETRARLEATYLGLRTANGLPVAAIGEDRAVAWCERGWALRRGERVTLTAQGWLVLDALVLDLTRHGGRA